jgi:hypothetical protein
MVRLPPNSGTKADVPESSVWAKSCVAPSADMM